MKISVKLIEHENEFIANCPELDINCYGGNRNDAIRRIQSVINFYIESAKELGLDVENLSEIMIEGEWNREFESGKNHMASESIN
jgi:phosphosulfolactate synthase (CoM biosynthesis protein A)